MIHLFEYHKIGKEQKDVDFLIPFFDVDRRYCLDPALLRFSITPLLKKWNEELENFLKLVHQVIKGGDKNKLKNLLNIGEAPDAGFGYCEKGVSGSGFGKEISDQVISILSRNEDFKRRGFIRIEELQWFDRNIGPDRISDLVIHILKRDIIRYTQKQCKKHDIPMEEVRVNKVLDGDTLTWISIKTEMPINPYRTVRDAINPNPPILFLPKEVVKTLPLFLNYDEYYGFIDPEYRPGSRIKKSKSEIVERSIADPGISTKFIQLRESERELLYTRDFDSGIHKKIEELGRIKSGDRKEAHRYRELVAEILPYVFKELELSRIEKRTILGTGQRDIILRNNAVRGFFSDIKIKHSATYIVVDTKNTDSVTAKDVAQVSNYLNDDIGRVGFIVSRKKKSNYRQHALDQLKNHKKVILFISDSDLKRWVTDLTRIQQKTGKHLGFIDPVKSIENKYTDIVSD